MKKLSLILVLMVFPVLITKANVISVSNKVKAIDLAIWDNASRSAISIPIGCYLIDNYIEIYFMEYPKTPITLQIKDIYGSIVYQMMRVGEQQDVFKIEISDFQPGFYTFYYSDGETKLKGEFELE